MKMTCIKSGGALIPTDQDEFAKIPQGAEVMIEYVQSRNVGNHRRFYSMINQVFDMQEFFDNKEIFRKYITMSAGYFEEIPNPTPSKSPIYIAKSIAFEKMDEIEFKELFSKCIDVFIKKFGNGMTQDELMRVVDYV